MFDRVRLAELPPFAKLFIGIFTTLMLLVCGWAVAIFYIEKGMVEEGELPAYLAEDPAQLQYDLQQDATVLAEDSEAVIAPVWDTEIAGEEIDVDTIAVDEELRDRIAEGPVQETELYEEKPDLRHNIGLAHTHINGQTLLFFAIGLVFLFTSTPARLKKITLWLFGIAIVVHAVGLTGEGYYRILDDILAVSGVAILLSIVFMAFRIYADLAKKGS